MVRIMKVKQGGSNDNFGDLATGKCTLVIRALPPSLGELGPSLTWLDLPSNDITSLPTQIGALTGGH